MKNPTPQQVESTAIELYTIAKNAALDSSQNADGYVEPRPFEKLHPAQKVGWMVLAKWHLERLPLILALALLAGCATTTKRHACVVLEFSHAPSPATVKALAATTHDTASAVQAWFDKGETGFVIADDQPAIDQTALAAALADGGEVVK